MVTNDNESYNINKCALFYSRIINHNKKSSRNISLTSENLFTIARWRFYCHKTEENF